MTCTRRISLSTVLLISLFGCQSGATHKLADGFTDTFNIPHQNLASTGGSAYFSLEPGFQQVYEGKEEGKVTQLVVTVLNETLIVDGVETRIIEERETADGQLAEISRNYFAIDKQTGDVYYFGEDVDLYKDGKVTGHGGSWRSGVDGAHFGLAMPGKPVVGLKYYQELAPGHAMDRAEVVAFKPTVSTPAGEFHDCVVIEETTPLEPGTRETKIYGPKAGMLGEEELKLVKYGMAGK